jgi:hypothetical protein
MTVFQSELTHALLAGGERTSVLVAGSLLLACPFLRIEMLRFHRHTKVTATPAVAQTFAVPTPEAAVFTMAPAFDSRSAGNSAFVSRIAANRLRAKPACHSSSGMDAVPCGNPRAPPALFTRMSRPPRASSAPAAMAFTPEAEATSPATNAAPAGKASPRERAVTTTFAPASSRRCAIAAPMPRVPPVTSARRPMSSLEKSSLLDMRFPFHEGRCVLRTARDPHEQFEVVRESIEIVRAAWRDRGSASYAAF